MSIMCTVFGHRKRKGMTRSGTFVSTDGNMICPDRERRFEYKVDSVVHTHQYCAKCGEMFNKIDLDKDLEDK